MSNANLFSINPIQVEYCLALADFNYPRFRDTEFNKGWSRFKAFPKLYELTLELNRCPQPQEGFEFLMDNCDKPKYRENERIINRGKKLYMDFCRDLHTYGLLQRHPEIGSVQYTRILDISQNIDFLITLLTGDKTFGVQCKMRLIWNGNEDPYEELKAERRNRRGDIEWPETIYYLTNRDRPFYKDIKMCWLFGPGHVSDLVEQIKNGSMKTKLEQNLSYAHS